MKGDLQPLRFSYYYYYSHFSLLIFWIIIGSLSSFPFSSRQSTTIDSILKRKLFPRITSSCQLYLSQPNQNDLTPPPLPTTNREGNQNDNDVDEPEEDPIMSFFTSQMKEKSEGNLYVDEKCIDCDVCRWMCPSVYTKKGVFSAVYKQPETVQEKIDAYGALVACPVGAIHTKEADPLMKEAIRSFPKEIDSKAIPGVMHAGYHAAKSFGATPYFLKREKGNVLIDCPRFSSHLAKKMEALGGLNTMILTHRDDIADHRKWKERFPQLNRVIHSFEVNRDSDDCEIQLKGQIKWYPDNDLEIIFTPGHTAGSICVLYDSPDGGDSVLFTGDHLAFDESLNELTGFKQFNRGNIEAQAQSIELLGSNEYDFTWILPGHGRRKRFNSLSEKNEALQATAQSFRGESPYRNLFRQGYHPRP